MIASLQALLSPHDPAELHAAVRERRRLHLRTGNRELFRHLLPWSAFNHMLGSDRLLDDRTRMVRRGRDLPREMWTYINQDLKRVGLPDQLQRFCHEGLSIAINDVDGIPAIAALNAMMERSLMARVQTNIYASFGRESAFRTHHDTHDVLILHLHGRKRWFCYGHRPDAYAKTAVVPNEALGPPQWEDVLEPGDILYVPRGDVHRASVEGEACLHLTNALLWPRGTDLLQWLAKDGMPGIDFDPDVPVYGTAEDMRRYEQTLRATLRHLADTLDLGSFLSAFGRNRRAKSPFNLGLSSELAPDVWARPMLRQDVSLPAEGEAAIPVNGGTLRLDSQERAVLAALLDRGACQIADLPALTGLAMEAVRASVGSLARRSLILLEED
ncbi:JmjC domain-containing protein [Azospirillum sp. TSH100]|uniref:JmjC domain-containing protein n=1 Tax=Azospirillum sp. TSH100 TaxID=652764 RepID=UPI000D6458B6|nr:cupin domain-containing protein [Azospirillum sp. TSH100]QCG92166.1 lysine-specific demethylase [Azospirillum sp. TSH100]